MSNSPNTYTAPVNPYDLRAQIGQVMPEGLQHYHKARLDSVLDLYEAFANQNIDPQAAKNSGTEAYEEFKSEKYLPRKSTILKSYERDADETVKDNDYTEAAAEHLEATLFEPKFGQDGSALRIHKAETILKAGYGQLAQTQKKAGKTAVEQAIEDRKYTPENDPQLPGVLNWAAQQTMHETWNGGPQYQNLGRTNGQAATVLGLGGLINELRGALSRPYANSVPHPTGNSSRTFFLGITAANQNRISAQTYVDEVLVRMESLLKTHKMFLNRDKVKMIKTWMEVNRDPITDPRGVTQAVDTEIAKLESTLRDFFELAELEKFAAIHIEPTLGNAPAPRPAQPQPTQPTTPATPPRPRPFAPPTGPAFPAPGSRPTSRLKLPPLPKFTVEATSTIEPVASDPEPADEPAPIEYTLNFPEAKPDDGKLLHEEIPDEITRLLKAKGDELRAALKKSDYANINEAKQHAGPRTKLGKLLKDFESNGSGAFKLTESAMDVLRSTARENRIIARIGNPPAKNAERAVHDAYDEEFARLSKAEMDYAKSKVSASTTPQKPVSQGKPSQAAKPTRDQSPKPIAPEVTLPEDILSQLSRDIASEVRNRKLGELSKDDLRALKREVRRELISKYLDEQGITPSHGVIRAIETQLYEHGQAQFKARQQRDAAQGPKPQGQGRRGGQSDRPQSRPAVSSYEDLQKIVPNA